MTADREPDDLIQAVRAGDLSIVRSLLSGGADATAPNSDGRTPLHFAALAGPRDFREVTIRLQEDQAVTEEGRSLQDRQPLAVMAEITGLLLEHGARIDAKDLGGRTPLIWACGRGHAEVVRVLLEHKADVNHRDHDGQTALLVATRNGYADEIRMLVDHGANLAVEDNDGWSPLAMVLAKGMNDLARLLVDRGAPLVPSKPGDCPPLHQAVMYGCTDLVEFLLDRGADVNERGEGFRSALHWAAHEGRVPIGTMLIEQGALLDALDRDRMTPLGVAVASGKHEFAATLSGRGASGETGPQETLDHQIQCEANVLTLRNPSSKTRGYVALDLGRLGDRRAVEPLIRLLADESWWPRESAAEALGKLGDPRAAPRLLPLLGDPEYRVRAAAARSLGQLQARSAIEPLLLALHDASMMVRYAAVGALALFREPRCAEPLADCLEDPEPDVRLEAALALTPWRDPRATATLVRLLVTEQFGLRLRARQALCDLEWTPADESERVAWSIASCDWETLAAAGALAADPLLRILLETYNQFDQESEARAALGALRALEHVLATRAANISETTLGELAELDIRISYSSPIYSDDRCTRFEDVRLGDGSRVQELAQAELKRRGIPPP